uniref:Putative secreted protein n=1 Tax=Anopheles darlingi TaxID=43151 RepID=A0A2M4DNZ1_ANODA
MQLPLTLLLLQLKLLTFLLLALLLFRYLYVTARCDIQPIRTSDCKRSQILTGARVLVAAGFYREQKKKLKWTHPHIPQQRYLAMTAFTNSPVPISRCIFHSKCHF